MHIRYPHYMGYPQSDSYHSTSVCGVLFDAIYSRMKELGYLENSNKDFVVKTYSLPATPFQIPPLPSRPKNPAVATSPTPASSVFTTAPPSAYAPPTTAIPSMRTVFDARSSPLPESQNKLSSEIFLHNNLPPKPRGQALAKEQKAALKKIAVAYVAEAEKKEGWIPTLVPQKYIDIASKKGTDKKYIAVKIKTTHEQRSYFCSKKQFQVLASQPDCFIYVVNMEGSTPQGMCKSSLRNTENHFRFGNEWTALADKTMRWKKD